MYRIIPLVVGLLVLTSCAQIAQNDANARMQQYADQVLNAQRSGQIGWKRTAELLRDRHAQIHGRTAATDEYWSYNVYLGSEVDAGRMTGDQANYLSAQKYAEIQNRNTQNLLMLAPLLMQQQQQQPAYRPVAPPAPAQVIVQPTPAPTYQPPAITDCQPSIAPRGGFHCTTR